MNISLIDFSKQIFKYPRSLTGKGVIQTLNYISDHIPLNIIKVKSGSTHFDWTVPDEWNINEAYIEDLETSTKIVDFKSNNLHVISYSDKINKILSYDELIENLFFLEDQPNAIPYITSYYKKRWGFCMSYNKFKKLNKKGRFRVFIDSSFNKNGSLAYGECYIKGESKKEILVSTYVCHPQMANNEISGITVTTALASQLRKQSNYYSYRFVFVPETIGSIVFINKNFKTLKENVVGGYVVTCVGDERSWGVIGSRYGNNISETIAKKILSDEKVNFISYSWLERGSDERQYCAPFVDLPISSVTRSKYGEYPEYHTSLDNFDLVTQKGLSESFRMYLKFFDVFEFNHLKPKIKTLCEPQLGKRKLMPNVSDKNSFSKVVHFKNFISYCDGKNTILEISNFCSIRYEEAFNFFKILKENNLIET